MGDSGCPETVERVLKNCNDLLLKAKKVKKKREMQKIMKIYGLVKKLFPEASKIFYLNDTFYTKERR